ncbi:MAG: hypothetical protein AAFV93_05230 [Chloroflexota bacterium]
MMTFIRFVVGGFVSATLTVALCFGISHGISALGLPNAVQSLVHLVFVLTTPPLAIIIGLLGGVQCSEYFSDYRRRARASRHYFVG